MKRLELSGGDEDAPFERMQCRIVSGNSFLDDVAEFGEALAHGKKTLVELGAGFGNAFQLVGDLLLMPAVRDGQQERDESDRAGDHDTIAGGKGE